MILRPRNNLMSSDVFGEAKQELAFCMLISLVTVHDIIIRNRTQNGFETVLSGSQMDKLTVSRLAELAKEILATESTSKQTRLLSAITPKLTVQEASHKLQQIDEAPDPFCIFPAFCSWVIVGFAIPPFLGGTWYDVLLSTVLPAVNFGVSTGLGMLPVEIAATASEENTTGGTTTDDKIRRYFRWLVDWQYLIYGFVSGLIATISKVTWTNTINTAIVILGAVAIALPGYGVSIGVIDLCYNRIVPGFGHLLHGVVVLLWLALGAMSYVGSLVHRQYFGTL
jgi:uncharacterized membrane protein YjjP (DUF1212 family)